MKFVFCPHLHDQYCFDCVLRQRIISAPMSMTKSRSKPSLSQYSMCLLLDDVFRFIFVILVQYFVSETHSTLL